MTDNSLKFFKVTALPEVLTPNAMYLVKNNETLEIYITNKHGTAKVSTLSKDQVNVLVAAATATTLTTAKLYADHVGRETLNDAHRHINEKSTRTLEKANKYTDEAIKKFNPPSSIKVLDVHSQLNPADKTLHNCFILVRDASGDSTVNKGSATYVFDASNQKFVKVSEHESMDLEFEWNTIKGRPESSPETIDEAVKNSKHENIAVLDALSEDEEGQLLYKGKVVGSDVILHSVEW